MSSWSCSCAAHPIRRPSLKQFAQDAMTIVDADQRKHILPNAAHAAERSLRGRGQWRNKAIAPYAPFHRRTRRSRSEFVTTLTEDRAMAAAAMMGDRSIPKTGYNAPAATGTPSAL